MAYTLTYSTSDCSGNPGVFRATNQSTCTPTACSSHLGASWKSFCYTGTLSSLANPVQCSGCAYCGRVEYSGVGTCTESSWIRSEFYRLNTCIADMNPPGTSPGWFTAYNCSSGGTIRNAWVSSVSTCAGAVFADPNGPYTPCVAGNPQCIIDPKIQGYCSYTGIVGGGGPGANGTNGFASLQRASLLAVLVLLWATL